MPAAMSEAPPLRLIGHPLEITPGSPLASEVTVIGTNGSAVDQPLEEASSSALPPSP